LPLRADILFSQNFDGFLANGVEQYVFLFIFDTYPLEIWKARIDLADIGYTLLILKQQRRREYRRDLLNESVSLLIEFNFDKTMRIQRICQFGDPAHEKNKKYEPQEEIPDNGL